MVIFNDKQVEWQCTKQEIESNTSSFDSLISFIKKSFTLHDKSKIKLFQIDTKNDLNNQEMCIEDNDDFVLCFEETQVAYFSISVNLDNININKYKTNVNLLKNSLSTPLLNYEITSSLVPYSDDNKDLWEKEFSQIVNQIGKCMRDNQWQNMYQLSDAADCDNVLIETSQEFSLLFDDDDQSATGSQVMLILKVEWSMICCMY